MWGKKKQEEEEITTAGMGERNDYYWTLLMDCLLERDFISQLLPVLQSSFSRMSMTQPLWVWLALEQAPRCLTDTPSLNVAADWLLDSRDQ